MQKLMLVLTGCGFCMIVVFACVITGWKEGRPAYAHQVDELTKIGSAQLCCVKGLGCSPRNSNLTHLINNQKLVPAMLKRFRYMPSQNRAFSLNTSKKGHAYANGISEHDGRVWLYMNEN